MNWGTLIELFGAAMLACLALGAVAPLAGVHLFLRRTSFYGLALPQFAAFGVALGFVVMPWWIETFGLGDLDLMTAIEDTHQTLGYHLSWAALATFGAIGVLSLMGRQGGSETARVSAAFALAGAGTILLASLSPAGGAFVEGLLRGDILAVGRPQLVALGAALALSLGVLWCGGRRMILEGYDPDMAQVLGIRRSRARLGLSLAVGLVVATGTLCAGPVVLFGLLVIPPLAARPWARSMASLFGLASLLGVLASGLGIYGAFTWDLPLGPCIVLGAGLTALPGWTKSCLTPQQSGLNT